jgi:hypothetical protein
VSLHRNLELYLEVYLEEVDQKGFDLNVGSMGAWRVICSDGRHDEGQDSNYWLTFNRLNMARIDNTCEVIHGGMVEGGRPRGVR